MINKEYTADNIHILQGLEGVRKRPAMYVHNSASAGLHQLIWEIVDNSVDEAIQGYGNNIIVTIHKDGSVSVLDEGRGIPVGINKETGRPGVEIVFTELHAGGKFDDSVYKTSGGLHGVGASVTNALSEFLEVTVYRDGNINYMKFVNGGHIETPLTVTGTTRKHGTLVHFKPDASIFSTTDFKYDTVCSRLQEKAYLLKGVKFIINDERVNESVEYCYQDGLVGYVKSLNENKNPLSDIIYFEDTDSITGIYTEVALQWCNQDYNETVISYVNDVKTSDGGSHETGFRTGITKAINDFAENSNLAKNKKLEGSDIREGMTAVISMKIPEKILEFEGQTKAKLGTPEATPVVSGVVDNKMTYYLQENKEFAVVLIKKCLDSQNARLAARKAKEEARSTKKAKQEVILSDKLTPAQSKEYAKNELFIVEGDSAGGTAKKGRDRIHQAILPLRGKPLNTDGLALNKLLQNEEIATIINTIGAGFGQAFDLDDIHYGKIIIMTDADTDGAHIQTLLLTFFYHYMRQLITSGHVYIAVPPLYRIYKEDGKHNIKEKYAWDDEGLSQAKKEIGVGAKISRYKGLGEMDAIQLKQTTMDPASRLLIQVDINDPFLAEKKVAVLMGKDTTLRKKWVEENVDFGQIDTFSKEEGK